MAQSAKDWLTEHYPDLHPARTAIIIAYATGKIPMDPGQFGKTQGQQIAAEYLEYVAAEQVYNDQ